MPSCSLGRFILNQKMTKNAVKGQRCDYTFGNLVYMGPDLTTEVSPCQMGLLPENTSLSTGEGVQFIRNDPKGALVEKSSGEKLIVSCESLREQAAKPTFFNLTAVVGSHLKNKNSVHSSTCPLQALTSVRIFKFKRLLHVASGFGVLDHKEEADAMQVRLGKLFPRLDAEWLHVAATTISSYLLADFSWITAALQNDRETFEIFAKCRLQVPMSSPLSKKQHDQIKEFYFLLQTVFIPALKEVRDNIPVSSEEFWCSLGVEFTQDTKFVKFKDSTNEPNSKCESYRTTETRRAYVFNHC